MKAFAPEETCIPLELPETKFDDGPLLLAACGNVGVVLGAEDIVVVISFFEFEPETLETKDWQHLESMMMGGRFGHWS